MGGTRALARIARLPLNSSVKGAYISGLNLLW